MCTGPPRPPVARSERMVLEAAEIGQQRFERPGVPGDLGPCIVVRGVAAHVRHPVDARGAAQHPAARPIERPAAELRFGVRRVGPYQARMREELGDPGRHRDPRVAIGGSRLEQEHATSRVGGQAVGEHAARGAASDDDEIRLDRRLHDDRFDRAVKLSAGDDVAPLRRPAAAATSRRSPVQRSRNDRAPGECCRTSTRRERGCRPTVLRPRR